MQLLLSPGRLPAVVKNVAFVMFEAVALPFAPRGLMMCTVFSSVE